MQNKCFIFHHISPLRTVKERSHIIEKSCYYATEYYMMYSCVIHCIYTFDRYIISNMMIDMSKDYIPYRYNYFLHKMNPC